MITGKNLLSDGELKISADGITFSDCGKGCIEFKTSVDDNQTLTYCVNDITSTQKLYDTYIKGIWKEEKDMKNELLEMYIKNARKDIEARRKKEIDNHKIDNLFIERYCDLVENFEAEMDALYLSQEILPADKLAIEHNFSDTNIYKYTINKKIVESELEEINEKYNKEIEELNEMQKEINGHLSMIRTCEEESYEKGLSVLITYGILTDEGKLNKYEKQHNCCECKKSGKKPKKEQ